MKNILTNRSKDTPDLDEIVFSSRNKEYGAFILRKNYKRYLAISLFLGILVITSIVIPPFINARKAEKTKVHTQRQVELKMENLDQPENIVLPPPPPPPPSNTVELVRYIAPVIVDSVDNTESIKLMTADEAQTKVMNSEVIEVSQQVKEEVKEAVEPEPFFIVQEMPEPPGGMGSLYKFISENTKYPEEAKENRIQGKVYVRFCVTSTGIIDKISIIKGVDPTLEAEAIRIVKSFPQFKPGKQAGAPVPVWFTMFINFKLD
jgi:periplasmic protein TonB